MTQALASKNKKKTLNLKGSDWSILLVARSGFRWLKYIVEWQIITKIDCCDYISLSTRFCMIKMTLKLWNCDIRDSFIRRSVNTRSLNISGDRRWDEIEKARGLWSIWYAEFSITWRKKKSLMNKFYGQKLITRKKSSIWHTWPSIWPQWPYGHPVHYHLY